MKRKLLLAALVVAGALGMRAQTDVTSTYLTNPSFEENGATVTETTSGTAVTGWTFSYSKSDKAVVSVWDNTTNATGYGKEVTPADETYYSQIRIRWENGINSGTLSQTSKTALPAGVYCLAIKYKAASSTNTNGTGISLTVKNGSTTIGTTSGTVSLNVVRDNTQTVFDDTHAWNTMSVLFSLESEATITIEAKFAANQNSDAIFDDVRLKAVAVATPIEAGADYYIYNEKDGQYISAGASWGTHAILDDAGHPMTAALNNGLYTLNTQQFGNNKYLSGLYMDSGTAGKWAFIETAEGSGKYYMTQDGFNYMSSNGTGTELINLTEPTEASIWTITTKAARVTALSSATKANPTNATFLINDQNFGRENQHKDWTLSSGTTSNTGAAGANENFNWQKWNGNFDYNQTVSNLPNGLYQMKAQGFYRPGANNTSSTAQAAYFYAGDEEVPIVLVSSPHKEAKDETNGFDTENTNETTSYYVPNSQTNASKAFTAGYYENTIDNILVSGGTLKIGAKTDATTSNEWTVIDNFRLYYYGPTISSAAEELPAAEMTADKWYYFDIPTDGEYVLTATTLNDIVYTTNVKTLVEDGSNVTDKFSDTEIIELTAGRYYVKSASAQTFAVAAHAYTYTVGDATPSVADNGYTQETTITLNYAAAATNDPTATLSILDASKITVNGESASVSLNDKVLTITLAAAVTASATYAVNVAAGAVGYNAENANNATSLTIKTPAVLDGTYFLYNELTNRFLGRGMDWGTRAVADKYGVAVNLVTGADGYTTMQFVDNELYLGNTWWMYADVASGNNFKVIASTVDGYDGYHFATKEVSENLSDKKFFYVYTKEDANKYACAGNSTMDENITDWAQTVWEVMTVAQRNAIVNAYPEDNINNVITASGVSTDAASFVTYLDTNYEAIDCSSVIGTAKFAGSKGDWTWTTVRAQTKGGNGEDKDTEIQPAYGTDFAEVWNATGTFTQTIDKTNLPAGIYKVTVQGFERRKANDAATALYTAGYNLVSTYLDANGEQVRFTDWNEVSGKPTNTDGAVAAFNNGEAVNEVYVYLDGNTDLTLTVKKPNYIWDCWIIMNNFTLTRYAEQASANMKIAAGKYATFCAPFNVTIPTGVTAYTVDDIDTDGTTLKTTEVTTTISANTPVILYSAFAVDQTFNGTVVPIEGKPVAGLLTGVYSGDTFPGNAYVLQTQEGVQAFYYYEWSDLAITPNRAYLTLLNGEAKERVLFLEENEDATLISVISALTTGEVEAIYTVGGTPLNGLQKGINIVKMRNGETKKVLVK